MQGVKAHKAASGAVLERVERLVVKVGSSLFVDAATGDFDRRWLDALCADVARIRARGTDVVIVSSGAVALGRRSLRMEPGPLRLEDKQAAAAAGQIVLSHAYQELLNAHGLLTAQVLLTLDDSESRRRYLNASRTLLNLLKREAVPVVNENDTVATQELRYGDNDRLAARVAQMISADCLVLLSDVDGLFTSDPQRDPDAEHIAEVVELNAEHLSMAAGPSTAHGSGGMRTKLDAARLAVGHLEERRHAFLVAQPYRPRRHGHRARSHRLAAGDCRGGLHPGPDRGLSEEIVPRGWGSGIRGYRSQIFFSIDYRKPFISAKPLNHDNF